MNITLFATLYAMSVPVFFLIDMVWLGVVAKNFYVTKLGGLMGEVNWVAAISFYLVFLVGLTVFVTYPGVVAKQPLQTTAMFGALFGFFTYATYDLTNLATLRGWPLSVSLVDMVWGAVLGGVVSLSVAAIYSYVA
jgi:uncharacterized membrane protein